MTSTALLVLNPREIPACIKALRSIDLPIGWISYMPEPEAAIAVNETIATTSYDRYLLIADDTLPTQDAIDAILELHDAGHPVVTGYCNLDSVLPFVNLTWAPLHAPPPTLSAYRMYTRKEAQAMTGPIATSFAGLAPTVMGRDLWQRFPLHCTALGGQMDYQLSWELQQEGIPIVAPVAGFVEHVKERWERPDASLEKRLLIGKRDPGVTWTNVPTEVIG